MKSQTELARIKLSWAGSLNQDKAVAYDTKNANLLWEITDYSLFLKNDQLLDSKTVRNEIFLLISFIDFVLLENKSYSDVDDNFLKKYRSTEFVNTLVSQNGSKSEKSAQRTVNAKLRRTYQFLLWLQETEGKVVSLIGEWGFPVTSTLKTKSLRVTKVGASNLSSKANYPLLFRHAGSNGLPSQYEASEEDVALLSNMFHAQFSSYAAERNILIMDLACEIGWRRGSINSLTCDQFTQLNFSDMNHDSYIVVPPSQKFGYERQFEVPFRLAFRVAEFIETYRRDLIAQNGWNQARTNDRIFLSERSGLPLRDASISSIFGKAFKKLRRPRGANMHSFRRKNVNVRVDQELITRMELGLDTSELSIAATVAFKVGQSRPESLQPYVNKRIGRLVRQREELKANRLNSLSEENKELKCRIADLEKALFNQAKP